MTTITEIAADTFRISLFAPGEVEGDPGLQISEFLVKDEEPLLFHTGFRAMFSEVREAIAKIIDPGTIRWIGFSHFEGDECGALNNFLDVAQDAQAFCSLVGTATSINDFAIRPPRPMMDGDVLETGSHRFRFLQTPHVPHCWDAGLLFDETSGTLFASDLLFQPGDPEPLTSSDVIQRSAEALLALQGTPFANVMPWTEHSVEIIHKLADLKPATIATHHGSVFHGNGERTLRDLATALTELYGRTP